MYNASVRTLPVGGTLSFSSIVGHTVHQMPTLAALQACDFSFNTTANGQQLFLFDSYNATFDLTFTSSGTYYLTCSISDHCQRGMTVIVQVCEMISKRLRLHDESHRTYVHSVKSTSDTHVG